MTEFRKKPIIIEAFQMHYRPGANYDGMGKDEWPSWLRGATFKEEETEGWVYRHLNGFWVIWTLEGLMEVGDGDYIIKGVKGELYPCKSDIFELTYEKV